MGKSKQISCVANYDFTRGYECNKFRTNLGLNDGCIYNDRSGLVVDTRTFTRTVPAGENDQFRASNWQDSFKNTQYTREMFSVKHCRELVLSTRASAVQFFNVDTPVPEAFNNRVSNIRGDPRLAHGIVFLLQPETGLIFGFTLTDQVVHAIYGRLPYAKDRSLCEWLLDIESKDCVPCKTGLCDTKLYNCNNFWEDLRYRSFKQNASQRDWIHFMNYIRWRTNCNTVGIEQCNWKEYAAFNKALGPTSCDLYSKENWVSWIAWSDYDEYQFFYDWLAWRELEAEFGRMGSCEVKCSGSCTTRVRYDNPSEVRACGGAGCSGCGTCKPTVIAPAKVMEKECYAYQWGKVRCCCDFQGASFLSLIPVAQTGDCDPVSPESFICLSVGIDRSHSTVRWYVNNVEVFKHVGIGRRTADQYRVRENGGYSEILDVTRVVAGFGTGSILDASLPGNYSRARVVESNGWQDNSNLVPLLCPQAYFNPYANRLGELPPVIPCVAFAAMTKESMKLYKPTDDYWRIFGQGAILRLTNLTVFSRTLPKLPVYRAPNCDEPYGPLGCGASCRISGGCDKKCYGGCCGVNCDAVDENCCDDNDRTGIMFSADAEEGVPVRIIFNDDNFDNNHHNGCEEDRNHITSRDLYS